MEALLSRHVKAVVSGLLAMLFAGVLVAGCGTQESAETPTPTPQSVSDATPDSEGPTPTTEPPSDPDFDAEGYFRGQTVRFITSSQPGGGADVALRYWASNWPQYLPGEPRMTVSNIAPHVTGKNFLWNAPPGGLMLGLFSTSIVREQPLPEAEFASSEFKYIGDVGDRTSV